MPGIEQGENEPAPDGYPRRRPPTFAGMGYRLAAAGPRTRQRLIERESGFPPPDSVRYAQPPQVTVGESWDPQRQTQRQEGDAPDVPPAPFARPSVMSEVAAERLGVMSSSRSRWVAIGRAAAIVACAGSGFALVLVGQSLHLDKTLHAAAIERPAATRMAAQEADNAAADASGVQEKTLEPRELAAAAPAAQGASLAAPPPVTLFGESAAPRNGHDGVASHETAVADAAGQNAGNQDSARLGADRETAWQDGRPQKTAEAGGSAGTSDGWGRGPASTDSTSHPGSAHPLASRHVAAPALQAGLPGQDSARARPNMHHAPARLLASLHPLPAQRRDTLAAIAPAQSWKSVARPSALRREPVHVALPAWLSRPQQAEAKPLIMSPPPHNLDAPAGSEAAPDTALAERDPAPRSLPPLAQAGAHGPPPILYAEAHYPDAPVQRALPPPTPYVPPYYQGYGGYPAYPYPQASW